MSDARAREISKAQISTWSSDMFKLNTPFDPRLAGIQSVRVCSTCHDPSCMGHLGHIELEKPIWRIRCVPTARMVHSLVCEVCSRPRWIPDWDDIMYVRRRKLKTESQSTLETLKELVKILKHTGRVRTPVCCWSDDAISKIRSNLALQQDIRSRLLRGETVPGLEQEQIAYIVSDAFEHVLTSIEETCDMGSCYAPLCDYKATIGLERSCISPRVSLVWNRLEKEPMTPEDSLVTFDMMTEWTIRELGFDVYGTVPRHLVTSVQLIISGLKYSVSSKITETNQSLMMYNNTISKILTINRELGRLTEAIDLANAKNERDVRIVAKSATEEDGIDEKTRKHDIVMSLEVAKEKHRETWTLLQAAVHMLASARLIDRKTIDPMIKKRLERMSKHIGMDQIIGGKHGMIRSNMAGKNVVQTFRTVLAPMGAHRNIWDIQVPKIVWTLLTKVENVSSFNILRLKESIKKGVGVPGGAVEVYTKRYNKYIAASHRGLTLIGASEDVREKIADKLVVGNSVRRYIVPGEWAILNRQPTLHQGSMLGVRMWPHEGRTTQMHPCITKPENADFDGDDGNVYPMQDVEDTADCINLASVPISIRSPSTNGIHIGLIQDSVVTMYHLTRPGFKVPRDVAMQMIESIQFDAWNERTYVAQDWVERLWPLDSLINWFRIKFADQEECLVRDILSRLFPMRFVYCSKASAGPRQIAEWVECPDAISEDMVLVYCGSVYGGCWTSREVGDSSSLGMINTMYKDFGPWAAAKFVSDLYRIATVASKTIVTTSIGLSDCIVPNELESLISIRQHRTREFIKKLEQVEGLDRSDRESLIMSELYGCYNDVESWVKTSVLHKQDSRNDLVDTIVSGAKGKLSNLGQLMGMVGQQMSSNGRFRGHLATTLPIRTLKDEVGEQEHTEDPLGHVIDQCHAMNVERALPLGNDDLDDPISHGMVASSFSMGLTPTEAWYGAAAARNNCIETNVKVQKVGQMSRDMVSRMLDNIVESFLTIQNSRDEVIDFAFGSDGFHPQHLETIQLQWPDVDEQADERFCNVEWNAMVSKAIQVVQTCLLQTTRGTVNLTIRVPWNPRRAIASRMEIDGHTECTSLDNGWKRIQEWKGRFDSIFTSRGLDVNWYLFAIYLVEFRPAILCQMTESAVEWLLEHTLGMIEMCFLTEGDVIGTITGMAIGQPIVQLTMNTIHTTGGKESVLSEGLNELKQIFTCSSKSVSETGQTLARMYLKAPLNYFQDLNEYVCMRLSPVRMRDVCQTWNVARTDEGAYVLEFVLDQEGLLRRDLWLIDVWNVLSKSLVGVASKVLMSDMFKDEWTCKVVCHELDEFKDCPDQMRGFVYQLGDMIWTKFDISRLMGIGACSILSGMRRPDPDQFQTVPEYEIVVRSALASTRFWFDSMEHDILDSLRTYCCDIRGMQEILGIEATSTYMTQTICRVMQKFNLDPRHTWHVVQTITRTGQVLPISVMDPEGSVLANASIRKAPSVFIESAIDNAVDPVKSMITGVILGQKMTRGGTGRVVLLEEESLMENSQDDSQSDAAEDEHDRVDVSYLDDFCGVKLPFVKDSALRLNLDQMAESVTDRMAVRYLTEIRNAQSETVRIASMDFVLTMTSGVEIDEVFLVTCSQFAEAYDGIRSDQLLEISHVLDQDLVHGSEVIQRWLLCETQDMSGTEMCVLHRRWFDIVQSAEDIAGIDVQSIRDEMIRVSTLPMTQESVESRYVLFDQWEMAWGSLYLERIWVDKSPSIVEEMFVHGPATRNRLRFCPDLMYAWDLDRVSELIRWLGLMKESLDGLATIQERVDDLGHVDGHDTQLEHAVSGWATMTSEWF